MAAPPDPCYGQAAWWGGGARGRPADFAGPWRRGGRGAPRGGRRHCGSRRGRVLCERRPHPPPRGGLSTRMRGDPPLAPCAPTRDVPPLPAEPPRRGFRCDNHHRVGGEACPALCRTARFAAACITRRATRRGVATTRFDQPALGCGFEQGAEAGRRGRGPHDGARPPPHPKHLPALARSVCGRHEPPQLTRRVAVVAEVRWCGPPRPPRPPPRPTRRRWLSTRVSAGGPPPRTPSCDGGTAAAAAAADAAATARRAPHTRGLARHCAPCACRRHCRRCLGAPARGCGAPGRGTVKQEPTARGRAPGGGACGWRSWNPPSPPLPPRARRRPPPCWGRKGGGAPRCVMGGPRRRDGGAAVRAAAALTAHSAGDAGDRAGTGAQACLLPLVAALNRQGVADTSEEPPSTDEMADPQKRAACPSERGPAAHPSSQFMMVLVVSFLWPSRVGSRAEMWSS